MREYLTACFAVGISAVVIFLARFYAARRSVWRLKNAGLPMPDFNLLTGHLLTVKEASALLPGNTVMHNVFWDISKRFSSGIFYVDLWPFFGTILVVTTPSAAAQVDDLDLGPPSDIVAPLETIMGGPSLLSLPISSEWKKWRRAFSVSFSGSYMTSLAPAIADEVSVFRKQLLARCSRGISDVFQLEELTLKMTFDIIGSVTLDTKLNYQTQDNRLARAMRTQIEWTSFGTTLNPFKRYFTIRPLVHWINDRRMNRYIFEEIDKRFAEHVTEPNSNTGKSRSIISLLIEDLIREDPAQGLGQVKESMKKSMAAHLRAFLFAGHDTTSSTLLFCYHLILAHPEALERLVVEHDEVFGPDPSRAQEIIHQDPQRLNALPYTLAVIKEVLRIFPPAATMRKGRPGAEITDDEGRRYPTDGCHVWTLALAMHHNPRFWPDSEAFKPERWLIGPENELYPVKGAWRPFSQGPKNCIGQTLALLELKIALVMTLREFCITLAYDEWDMRHPRRGIKTVNGNRVYQAEKGGGGAHPADGFPVRVKLREER